MAKPTLFVTILLLLSILTSNAQSQDSVPHVRENIEPHRTLIDFSMKNVVDSNKIQVEPIGEAPIRPIAQTIIGAGLLAFGLCFDVIAPIALTDYYQNPDGFLSDLNLYVGVISGIAGIAMTTSGSVLLFHSRRKWIEYKKWKQGPKLSLSIRIPLKRIDMRRGKNPQ